MNLTLTARQNSLLFVNFNQDYSCFAVGTENGFFICDCDPFKERFRRDFDDGGIGIIEMLFRCNILALVGGGKNPKFPRNKVVIWDDFRVQCIAELEFRSPVKGVRLRRDRIIVVLETKVYIYNFSDLKLIDQIDTFPNPTGLCAVCPTKDNSITVCLGDKEGWVRICRDQIEPLQFEGHKTAISQMCLSADGSKLATASTRGTLIRVFDTETGNQVNEFRRGAQTAAIHSIAFNKNGTAICVSSDRGTIHIYSCDDASFENRSSSFSFMSSVVPILGSSWSSKQFTVSEVFSFCAFGNDEKGKSVVFVLGASGRFYKYSFTPDSTECTLEFMESFIP